MKKLLVTSSACIIACIFFSSCGSSLSIAKRHYRKGLYIEFAKHNQAPAPEKTVEKTPPSKRTILSYTLLKPEKRILEMGVNVIPTPTKIQSLHKNTSEKPPSYKKATLQNASLIDNSISIVAKNTALQTERSFTEENEYHDDGGGRAALSLLWIVIVVILVLWLIGILAGDFGLGGLINVLLVIALILLILWLLRIV